MEKQRSELIMQVCGVAKRFQIMVSYTAAAAVAVCLFARGASAQDDGVVVVEEDDTIVVVDDDGAQVVGEEDTVVVVDGDEARVVQSPETSGPKTRQERFEDRENSYTVMLNQDAFFGFYPTFNGLIGLTDKISFSVYGILWTRPSFGLGADVGSVGGNLWGEFGVGASFALAKDRLFIKPQFGITNGALLSGGQREEGATVGTLVADGIVPNLTVNWGGKFTEAELYVGYYVASRGRQGDASLDFLHLWTNAGVKIFPAWSVGFHYEVLRNTRNTYPGGSPSTNYQWIGAYTQFNFPKGFFARFTAGADLEGSGSPGRNFYKIGAGMTF